MREEAVRFGAQAALVGVVSSPAAANMREAPAVIFLNAGGLHRVGPSRLYVTMARALAEFGLTSLRFDFSGFGDSDARTDQVAFAKKSVEEVQQAMDFLSVMRGIDRFVLIGICSGAETSYDVACCDSRVAGAALINGRGYDIASALTFERNGALVRRTATYLIKAWPRILIRKAVKTASHGRYTAEVTGYQLRRLLHGSEDSPSAPLALHKLAERGIRLLLIYDERDPSVEYMRATLGSAHIQDHSHPGIEIQVMKDADHTFNSIKQQQNLMKTVCKWVAQWSEHSAHETLSRSCAV